MSSSQCFSGDSFTFNDDVELVAVLSVSLSDDGVVRLEGNFHEAICDLRAFVMGETLQHWDRAQEVFVFISPCLRGIFHDMIESKAVKLK